MADRVLLAEDRENLRDVLLRALRREFDAEGVADGDQAIERLQEGGWSVVVSDVRMPGTNGTDVLAAARAAERPPEVVLMTAYADVPSAVAALKAGAYDYLAKPFEPDELLRVVRRAAERHRLVLRAQDLEDALGASESGFVGTSSAAQQVRRLIERLGPMPVPVLITGETGAGKEVVARELHRLRDRGDFIAVNCAAIPETPLDSELFGVAGGAFGPGSPERPGLLDLADGGTLFLDEIGDLAPNLQVKLNRVLEEGEFRRVGDAKARRVDTRLVSATHHNLEALITSGQFRQDLYYRLRLAAIQVPPLRDRRDDIPQLAARFLHLSMARYGTAARRLSPDAVGLLEAATWPGNVREFRHVVEEAAVLCDGETIDASQLPRALSDTPTVAPAGTWRSAQERAIDLAAREYFPALMRRLGGNVTKAAIEAGMERETLHRLLRRYNVDAGRFRP
ncbi:sigma-54 dependent transcriptional regulator [Myxococcota bacterium]|nr:sigma-54 dependent transcriptional regulator [Myxococcota bacterium]